MSPNQEIDPMASWMRQLANDPRERSHRPLPDPALLWMKAQLLNRQAAIERSLSLARRFETISRLLAGFAACWLVFILSKFIEVPATEILNPTLTSLVISLIAAAVVMLAFPIWSDE